MRSTVWLYCSIGVELDVVHDDEVVEVFLDGFDLLLARGENESRLLALRLAEDRAVAEDAPLGVEEEVIAAFAGGKRLHRVGDHAVEPAGGVRAGDAQERSVV